MENEIMNNVELDDVIEAFQTDEGVKGNMLPNVLLGAALAAGCIAAFKWGKKKWTEHKTKKTEGVLKFEDVENKTKDEEVTVE